MFEDRKITVKSFPEVSAKLTEHDQRLAEAETVTDIANKVWKFGRMAFPVILGAIIAGSGPGSALGKALSFILQAVQGGAQ